MSDDDSTHPHDVNGSSVNGSVNGSSVNGSGGARPHGMRTRRLRLAQIDDAIDLVAVQADDELLNALHSGMAVSAPGVHGYDRDDQVVAILAAWRAEVDAEPIPDLVDIETAVAVIAAARPPARRPVRWHLAPAAAAAALVVLTVGGVSFGSAGSRPGDALWDVSKVLYSQRAHSVEAAVRVENRISSAKQALVKGRTDVATQALTQARAELPAVRPQEGQADLAAVQSFLVAKADETPPGTPTDPGTPLKTDQARKVPKGAELLESPAPTDPASSVAPTSGSAPSSASRPTSSPLTASNGSSSATTSPVGPSEAASNPPATATTTPGPPLPTPVQGLGASGSPVTTSPPPSGTVRPPVTGTD